MVRVLYLYELFYEYLPGLGEVVVSAGGFYALLGMAMILQTFGVGLRNGVPYFSVFDRSIPLSTAKLVAIKLSVNFTSLLVAAIAMVFVIWVFGSLFVDNFDQIRAAALDSFADFTSAPALSVTRLLAIGLITFATYATLLASVSIWFMLKPELMSGIASILAVYAFSLAMFLAWITEPSELKALSNAVYNKHLWIFILGVPAALVFLVRELLRDMILNAKQFLVLVTTGLLVFVLQINYLSSLQFYSTESQLEDLLATSLLGVLPFGVICLALWTMNRIRHH